MMRNRFCGGMYALGRTIIVKGGARDYIIKPIKEDVLVEKVNKILSVEKDKLCWDDI